MYGTIARVQVNPEYIEKIQSLSQELGLAPGQLGRFVYQMDDNPHELFLVAVFENRAAYRANAASPEQHQRFLEMRALLDSDPEWHDGEIVDAMFQR